MTEQELLRQIETRCPIYIENVFNLSPDEYAMSRKATLGASDASVYLGLMKNWSTTTDMLLVKNADIVLEAEKAIRTKVNVQKGHDLEPLILQKFEALDVCSPPLIKPPHTYRHKDYDYLSVNFDGVMEQKGTLIPVEAKYVSTYGHKYWGDPVPFTDKPPKPQADLGEYCNALGEHYGIPAYYIPQVTQQMMCLQTEIAYLVALFEKTWELKVYPINYHPQVARAIIMHGAKIARTMKHYKGGAK